MSDRCEWVGRIKKFFTAFCNYFPMLSVPLYLRCKHVSIPLLICQDHICIALLNIVSRVILIIVSRTRSILFSFDNVTSQSPLIVSLSVYSTGSSNAEGYCFCRYSFFDNNKNMKMDNIIFVLWLDEIIITVKLGKLFSITPQILCPICTMERIIPIRRLATHIYIF